jgi:hypothetical protein
MNDRDFTPDHDRIERMLDCLSPGPERDAAVETLRAEGLGEAVDLHEEIEATLRRQFPVAIAPARQVEEVVAAASRMPTSIRWRTWGVVGVAAAALLLIAFAWGQRASRVVSPYFEPAPLVALYQEAVAQGFEPYYECKDSERFAAVFAKRQGLPLRLETMPQGSRMLGLSYPGGLSRDTTAMLCEVDGRPVMVFVDRLDADEQVEGIAADADGLRVFRSELMGLVVYEVTPLEEPRAAPFLAAGPSR